MSASLQYATSHRTRKLRLPKWLLSGSRETGGLTTFLLLINMFAKVGHRDSDMTKMRLRQSGTRMKPVTLLAVSSNLKQQGLPTVGPIGVGAGGYGQVSHQGGSTGELPSSRLASRMLDRPYDSDLCLATQSGQQTRHPQSRARPRTTRSTTMKTRRKTSAGRATAKQPLDISRRIASRTGDTTLSADRAVRRWTK